MLGEFKTRQSVFIRYILSPRLVDLMGVHGALSMFCLGSIVGLIFIVLMVPETKNKSLEEIEAELTGKLRTEEIPDDQEQTAGGKQGGAKENLKSGK